MMKKHIVIAKLFEFGGSNTHLKPWSNISEMITLCLLVEDKNQLSYLNGIDAAAALYDKDKCQFARVCAFETPVFIKRKGAFLYKKSILSIQILSIRHGFADITISAVEPENTCTFCGYLLAK